MIDSAATKRVLFIGEEITDVYHYVRPLNRPLKEAIVCVERRSTESFRGGVVAAARHAETFCDTVHVVSTRIVRKDRYVERAHTRKLFEEYVGAETLEIPAWPDFASYDAVVVLDYGHGMFDAALIERLCAEARFLAVNVQANAGNYGFNLATKWPHANYLCVDEWEARLATQNQYGDIWRSIGTLATKGYGRICITLGKSGAIGACPKSGFEPISVPAFTDRVVDTMGAGDAFFAVTAVMAEGADMAELLRIGNAAGALKAQIVGHRAFVTKAKLQAYLEAHGTARQD